MVGNTNVGRVDRLSAIDVHYLNLSSKFLRCAANEAFLAPWCAGANFADGVGLNGVGTRGYYRIKGAGSRAGASCSAWGGEG